MKKKIFDGFDLTNFWENDDAMEFTDVPLTETLLIEVENELGYKLPESYIHLMKTQNGGIPKNDTYLFGEPSEYIDFFVSNISFSGIGFTKDNSLCGKIGMKYMIEEWSYPEIGILFWSDGHTALFLDYTACGSTDEPKVVFVQEEFDYKITTLAENFEKFVRGLISYTELPKNWDI